MDDRDNTKSTLTNLTLVILVIVIVGLLILLIVGIIFPDSLPSWLGTSSYYDEEGNLITPPKTLWDLLSLLIIPVVLAVAAWLFNRSERQADRTRTEKRAKLERELQEERNRESMLQEYLDRMSELMLDKDLLSAQKGSPVRNIARTRTTTLLHQLDGDRKGIVIRFLKEARLIDREECVVVLSGADLRGVKLSRANLSKSNLVRVNLSSARLARVNLGGSNLARVNLTAAMLSDASLTRTVLTRANLRGVNLSGASLYEADLIRANLFGANLKRTNIHCVKLNGADLRSADLRGTDFGDTDLSGARLEGAKYDQGTNFPPGFDPYRAGLIRTK
jgi:membrane protein implicated in regulation of membrane protease activity